MPQWHRWVVRVTPHVRDPCLTNCLTTGVCSHARGRTSGDWFVLRLTAADVHAQVGNA
jgi:hypothetical protein